MGGIIKMEINKIYLNSQTLKEMRKKFKCEKVIKLENFLSTDFKNFFSDIKELKVKKNYSPEIFRDSKIILNKNFNFSYKLLEFFKSKTFLKFIKEITKLNLKLKKISCKKYSHKDFLTLNDKNIISENKIEIIFDLTKNWEKEFGGFICYAQKQKEILYLFPSFNTLTIILRKKSYLKYLKYINNLIKKMYIIRFEIEFEILK